ncbi:helix-turn-helix domain-containing protein [Gordonia polyisoprenivorans]|uniref:helix-turn-helix domain-containing protein n=1 Tax=Gordonia polyisoprenivorans TaxID=84595 RepID=UPI001F0A1BEC|nr:helix-turn-helix domain-containing protein [Gordonia polyisoprenivorans]
MQGLMYRLAELDADSAGMVRIIDYFDALLRHGADVTELLRASAVLADCVVGIRANGLVTRRCTPRGEWRRPLEASAATTSRDIVLDDHCIGTVWIEGPGTALPLDEMLVDRLALTAAAIIRPHRAQSDLEQSAALLNADGAATALDACSALDVDPTLRARVVSLADPTDQSDHVAHVAQRLARQLSPGRLTAVATDRDHLVVVTDLDETVAALSADPAARTVACGASLESDVATLHRWVGTARLAQKHCGTTNMVFCADEIGALNLLLTVAPESLSAIPDVARCDYVRQSKNGADLLDTLRVYLQVGTLRDTAEQMHMHHSSIATRLKSLSAAVHFDVTAIENRARATAMLLVDDLRRDAEPPTP